MALTLTKLSILLQYWRVFVSENFRKVVIVLFAFTSLYGKWDALCIPFDFFGSREKQASGLYAVPSSCARQCRSFGT